MLIIQGPVAFAKGYLCKFIQNDISLFVITFCMLFLHAFHLNANMHYIFNPLLHTI